MITSPVRCISLHLACRKCRRILLPTRSEEHERGFPSRAEGHYILITVSCDHRALFCEGPVRRRRRHIERSGLYRHGLRLHG